jgi:Leucine-rich repeat (LRR) protein
MPAGTDGAAHLFFAGDEPAQIMAVSTTGCIAVQAPDNPVRVFHWHYRMKGQEFIRLEPAPWLILWSCRAPWNTEPCGNITRLHVSSCGLTAIDARELKHLAHLRCDGNLLERLDCSGMAGLKSLDCSGNDLVSLTVEGCHRLLRLGVGGNRRLRQGASDLLTRARGEPKVNRHRRLTATSLFDL